MTLLKKIINAIELGVEDSQLNETRTWQVEGNTWHLLCEASRSVEAKPCEVVGEACECVSRALDRELTRQFKQALNALMLYRNLTDRANEMTELEAGGVRALEAQGLLEEAEQVLNITLGHPSTQTVAEKASRELVKRQSELLKYLENNFLQGVIGKEALGVINSHKETATPKRGLRSKNRNWPVSDDATVAGVPDKIVGALFRTWSSRGTWEEEVILTKMEKALTFHLRGAAGAAKLAKSLLSQWEDGLRDLPQDEILLALYGTPHLYPKHGDDLRALNYLLRSTQVVESGKKQLLAMPRYAYIWLQHRTGRHAEPTHYGAVRHVWKRDAEPWETLKTALVLWNPALGAPAGGTDTLESIEGAIRTAREIEKEDITVC